MSARVEAARLYAIECGDGNVPLWTVAEYKEELENPASRLFTPDSQEISSFVLFRALADEIWIMQLAVERKRRGEGRALLSAFLASLRSQGESEVGLEVSEKNVAARRLYESMGFKKVGERRAYYRNGDSAWVMKLAL